MKISILLFCILCHFASVAQRPATAAEKVEDARVLKILSDAMPHNIYGADDPSERSFGESNLSGVSGYYNDVNYATRDVFEHQYTISYQFTKPPQGLEEKVNAAKEKNDLEYLQQLSICDVEIYVNSQFTMPNASLPLKKLNASYCQNIYRDARGAKATFLFFGNNWSVKPITVNGEDDNGKPVKKYSLAAKLDTHPGTEIQGIVIYIKGHSDVADMIIKQIDWQKISGLIGTGKIKEDESESDLKKYFLEKPVAPVAGANTLSFTYTGADGKAKNFSIISSKHDLSNGATLKNRNENPRIMQDANIDFRIKDDKDENKVFVISLPVIRTTGTVTATFQSDYDYKIMWRGNPDSNHSFSATTIEIHLTKWAAVGDFLEGTFSGTATLNDHNDGSSEKPVYTITNGKFRIRRSADQLR